MENGIQTDASVEDVMRMFVDLHVKEHTNIGRVNPGLDGL